MQAHLIECKYTPAHCTNEGCNKLLPLDELKFHLENECDFGQVNCQYCGETTIRMKLDVSYYLSVVCTIN